MARGGAPMTHDVFICYSTRDKPVADATCAVLEADGVRCWIAPRDILPGADWGESIIDAINDARAMVLIFSSNANSAQAQIKREVERAVNKGIPVIPFRIENVTPTKSLEYFLSTPHWLDAFTPPLDEHVRQLAESLKRLLGREVISRPLLFLTPPSMPELPKSRNALHFDFSDIRIGGKPPLEWAKVPRNAAVLAVAGVILAGILWFSFRPTATPEDRQVWTVAATEDTIPAYQLYMREQPDGYFRDKAQERSDEIKTEVNAAFQKAKQTNTPQAYASFVQTYGRQGLNIPEAQEGYSAANLREGNARDAYRRAISSRSREGYQAFLNSFGSSSYAADIRQRQSSCHSETRNSGVVQNSTVQASAAATATNPTAACSEARANAASKAEQSCTGRVGNIRIVSQRAANAVSSSDAGRVAGQVLTNTLFGSNRGYNYNNSQASYQCQTEVVAVCAHTTNSSHAVEVCQ
jgi:hypothetical protein